MIQRKPGIFDTTGNIGRIVYEDGKEIRYGYDALLRKRYEILSVTGQEGIINGYTYDKAGNVLTVTDSQDHTITYTYDVLNRLTSTTDEGLVTSYTYDSIEDDLITNSVQTGTRSVTNTTLDRLGRTVREETVSLIDDNLSLSTEYTYDILGNVLSKTFNDGSVISYQYDARGHKVKEVWKTNDQGIPKGYTDYRYDEDGRLVSMTDHDTDENNITSVISSVSYSYDALSRTIQYVQDGEAVNYGYTPDNKISSISYADHNVTGENTSDTVRVSYLYDSDRLLSEISLSYYSGSTCNNSYTVAEYSYDPYGRKASRKVYRDFEESAEDYVEQHSDYNELGLISSLTYKDSDNLLLNTGEEHKYSYDTRGYLTSERTVNRYTGNDTEVITNYGYDLVGRLTTVTGTNGSVSYAYNIYGDRNTMTKDGKTTSYSYNGLGQLTESTGPNTDDQTLYRYSSKGELTEQNSLINTSFSQELEGYNGVTVFGTVSEQSSVLYSYDEKGRLTSSEKSSTVTAMAEYYTHNGVRYDYDEPQQVGETEESDSEGNYTYNGNDQRVKKEAQQNYYSGESEAVNRKYYYTGSAILFVTDSSNYKTIENILEPDGTVILSRRYERDEDDVISNAWYTYDTDLRGSVTTIIKEDGSCGNGYVYDEFGNIEVTVDNSILNELTYTGAVYDSESGLYYMNARYYDSDTARFISRDTYTGNAYSPWTQNLYSYTGNNPVNYTDPTGHMAFFVATGIVGAIAGGLIGAIGSYFRHEKISLASVGAGAIVGASVGVLGGLAISYFTTGKAVSGVFSVANAIVGENKVLATGLQKIKMAFVRFIGKLGEILTVGEEKNTTRIPSITGTAHYRIPDYLSNTILKEVKNVRHLSFTSQIKDYLLYSQNTGRIFELLVRKSTTFSPELGALIKSGVIKKVIAYPW